MGKILKPDDIVKSRGRAFEEAAKDLSPGVREATVKILESWSGKDSEEKLRRLLGVEKAKRIINSAKK